MKQFYNWSGWLIGIFIVLSAFGVQASEDIDIKELVEVESRPGVEQKFILLAPKNPVASAILIGGGPGNYGMYESFGKPTIKNDGNFLVRTRKDFAKEGLAVAVIDICSDLKKSKKGMTVAWRMGDKHLRDIQAVAVHLKKKFGVPVWVVGTSRGTWSTINAAINLNDYLHGFVVTSSITQRPKAKSFKHGILDMSLDQVILPALIVAHKNDKCFFSPPNNSDLIKTKLTNSPRVEVKFFSGGKHPKTKACKPLSQHGFYGIEKEVVEYISQFIMSN